MTALKKYQRLESTGLWRATPDAQRRDVIVSFGEASLVLSDKTDTALTHWSLAAITRVNPRARPALYSPDPEATETLEIADETMVQAIDQVISAIERAKPHPGRLRLAALAASIALVIAVGIFWLPGALIQHTASVVPDVTRAQIGRQLLGEIYRLAGQRCATPLGDRALDRLRARVAPAARTIIVLPQGVARTQHLPGGFILVRNGVLSETDDPQVVAGYVRAEALRMRATDPLIPLLHDAGMIATFRLLTTGEMPPSGFDEHAARLLSQDPVPVSDDLLVGGFAEIGLPIAPYAAAQGRPQSEVDALSNALNAVSENTARIISDGDWISIQSICMP